MRKVALVGSSLAKVGMRFVHGRPSEECMKCKLRKVCMESLEPGRVYEVVKVRGVKHPCPIHSNGVVVVEVAEAPIKAAIPSKMAIEGAIITFRPVRCSEACPHKHLCSPIGLFDGDKCKVLKVESRLECPKGYSLHVCVLKPIIGK